MVDSSLSNRQLVQLGIRDFGVSVTLQSWPSLFAVSKGEIGVSPVVALMYSVMVYGQIRFLNDNVVNHAYSASDNLLFWDVFTPQYNWLWQCFALPNIGTFLLMEDRGKSSASPATHVELLWQLVNVVIDYL